MAVAALLVGVPLFLRSPPWCDLTLYQLAARNLLTGGVHYRDLFDTNLPGFVWALTAIQALCGEGVVAVRAFDLAVVAGVTAALAGAVRAMGGARASRAWFVAAVALFYPFTAEFDHAQRDVWMALPAALAFGLRLRNRRPLLEGLLWGCAVWVKPHVVVPAFAVWAASLALARPGRGRDAAWLLAGGATVGVAGVAWLVASGAWPDFVDVFTVWNPEYTAGTFEELPERFGTTFLYFPPWSLTHAVTVPLALALALRLRRPEATAAPRALFAVLYLAWLAQALVLQRGLEYVHVPEMLLALALLAGVRVPVGLLALGVLLLQGALTAAGCAERLPTGGHFPIETPRAFDARVLRLWPRCFAVAPGSRAEAELWDGLAQYPVHCSPTWLDLLAVQEYLRTVQPPLRDGELLAFHDSPHPLYLRLGVRPAARYMHFGTALSLRSQQPRIAEEVRRAGPRFVVSDLKRMTWRRGVDHALSADGRADELPAWFPASQRGLFPWDQPIKFRSGRYVVHAVARPIGEVDIPAWGDLGRLADGR